MPITEHEKLVRQVANTVAALITNGELPPDDDPLLGLIWDQARADMEHRRKMSAKEKSHRKLMAWYSDRIQEQMIRLEGQED